MRLWRRLVLTHLHFIHGQLISSDQDTIDKYLLAPTIFEPHINDDWLCERRRGRIWWTYNWNGRMVDHLRDIWHCSAYHVALHCAQQAHTTLGCSYDMVVVWFLWGRSLFVSLRQLRLRTTWTLGFVFVDVSGGCSDCDHCTLLGLPDS